MKAVPGTQRLLPELSRCNGPVTPLNRTEMWGRDPGHGGTCFMPTKQEFSPLLADDNLYTSHNTQVVNSVFWTTFQCYCFCFGGSAFLVGTLLNFYPESYFREWAAILYTGGSLGFISVDVIDFLTYKGNNFNRGSIMFSMIGNVLYAIGSIAFFPTIIYMGSAVGVWSFIVGSVFIILSQLWKIYRIGSEEGSAFNFRKLFRDMDCAAQTCVELNTGIGACFFFYGTAFYLRGHPSPHMHVEVLDIWGIGSTCFLMGSLVLVYRNFSLTK